MEVVNIVIVDLDGNILEAFEFSADSWVDQLSSNDYVVTAELLHAVENNYFVKVHPGPFAV